MSAVTTKTVNHIAKLAAIPVSAKQAEEIATAFTQTLQVIEHLNTVDVKNIEPTHQVTGLENVFRDDVIDESRQFTQAQALANAQQTHQGFVVVPRILSEK